MKKIVVLSLSALLTIVTTLYNALLDREPDTTGYQAWVAHLSSGGTRLSVFNGVANSQEFHTVCSNCGIDW